MKHNLLEDTARVLYHLFESRALLSILALDNSPVGLGVAAQDDTSVALGVVT